MKLLNKKSIIDCNDAEQIVHNHEIDKILNRLRYYQDFECAAIFKNFDEANKEKEPVIKQCNLYNCLDMVQYADTKNGIDLALVENFLTFICYGQEYSMEDGVHIKTTGIQIRPYRHDREFVTLLIR